MHSILFRVAELVLRKEVILMQPLASETVQIISPEPWPMHHLNYSGFVQVSKYTIENEVLPRRMEKTYFKVVLSTSFILVQSQMC